jgi:hypothetical protein
MSTNLVGIPLSSCRNLPARWIVPETRPRGHRPRICAASPSRARLVVFAGAFLSPIINSYEHSDVGIQIGTGPCWTEA